MTTPAHDALPEEIVAASRPRRIAATVAGVLVLVALINAGAVVILQRHPVNHGYEVIKAKWRLLRTQHAPVDWLVLGDSSGNQGTVPDVLSRRLGGTALNLCTVGGLTAVHDAWILERYLAAVGTPRHVILVHAYDVWSRDPNLDAFAQVPVPLGELRGMSPHLTLGAGEVWRVLLDRYVPLYSQDQSLSRLISAPRKTLGRRFEMDEHGYLRAGKPLPEEVRADAKIHAKFVKKNAFRFSPQNLEALRVIADLADAKQIDVYLAHGPVFEGLYEEPSFRAYLSQLRNALNAFAAEHPRVHFVDLEPLTFRADEMTNADHLVYPAALVYSAALSEKIAARLAGAAGSERTARVEKTP